MTHHEALHASGDDVDPIDESYCDRELVEIHDDRPPIDLVVWYCPLCRIILYIDEGGRVRDQIQLPPTELPR